VNEDRRERLIGLGADALADVLLGLVEHHDDALNAVERVLATPEENVRRFKAQLGSLRRMHRLIRYGESGTFARDLLAILDDLKAGVNDPAVGMQLVAAFTKQTVPCSIILTTRTAPSATSIGSTPRICLFITPLGAKTRHICAT
jgi:hypothetical protein